MSTEGGLQRQFFEMLMDSQWWSPDQLRNYQRSQLSHLLRHAKKNVPFYEHRLDAVVKPNGDIDWDRWNEIPIVKRQDMVDHREAMQAKELPAGHGDTKVFRSSGSSGQPIEVTVNGLTTLVNTALRWRFHVWNDLAWQETLAIWQLDETSAADMQPLGPWGPTWSHESTGVSWGIRKNIDNVAMARFIADSRCAYVNRGPKAMHVFALDCERLGLRVSFNAVLTQGEGIDDSDRAVFERIFGARTLELYSAKESGHIAHACDHAALHLAEEAVVVEVLDDSGKSCPVGVQGKITVTPLYFTAQPIIRYQLGDIAELGPSCSCGRRSRVLARVLGRATAIFTHPDGRAICNFLPAEAKAILNCGLWQFAQVGPLDFEVRYVPRGYANEAAFTRLFRKSFFSDARVTYRRMDHIGPARSGKYLEYVNEYAAS